MEKLNDLGDKKSNTRIFFMVLGVLIGLGIELSWMLATFEMENITSRFWIFLVGGLIIVEFTILYKVYKDINQLKILGRWH